MQRRFLLSALVAAVALTAAGCVDQTPTLAGDDEFPPGVLPLTREVVLPASEFFRALGTFDGYSRAADLGFVVVAHQFQGLEAHALARLGPFPVQVNYRRDGADKRDAAFTYTTSSLVLRVDTTASTREPVTVQVWQAAQAWERRSATWTTAIDTGGVTTAWTTPGGTRGSTPLAEGIFETSGATGDTLVLSLSGAAVTALSDTLAHGVVITTSTPGARLEVFEMVLRAAIRPDSALPDTIIVENLGSSGRRTTIYTPEAPLGGPGVLAVGGVRSARSIVEIRPDQPLPACAEGETCGTIPLRDVQLNSASLLLRPLPVLNGFEPLTRVPLSLRLVDEAELGAGAPLGPRVLDVDPQRATQIYDFVPGDTVVELPVTNLVRSLAISDSLPRSYALVSELLGFTSPPTFGVAFFAAEPRLRIVYTLPARRRLP